MKETTALGAAFLAGLATGFWQDLHELRNKSAIEVKERTNPQPNFDYV
jgi:glycerol kinase